MDADPTEISPNAMKLQEKILKKNERQIQNACSGLYAYHATSYMLKPNVWYNSIKSTEVLSMSVRS